MKNNKEMVELEQIQLNAIMKQLKNAEKERDQAQLKLKRLEDATTRMVRLDVHVKAKASDYQKKIEIKDNKYAFHHDMCLAMNRTYYDKNHDYGDSYKKMREEYPLSILIRIFDKYSRLKNLLENPNSQKIKEESIDDTLLDLANYCTMERVERVWDKGAGYPNEEN